jgi:hypothetical protein
MKDHTFSAERDPTERGGGGGRGGGAKRPFEFLPSSAAPGHHLSHQSGDWLFPPPPLGLNLFLGSLRFQRPITRLCRASWPFLLILLVALARFTYIPDLSLGLVHLLGCADLSVFRRCREIIKASPLFLFRF